jgi:hypothetical protein
MTIVEVAALLVLIAVFVMVYYSISIREPVKYAITCSTYLLIAIYLVKQLI